MTSLASIIESNEYLVLTPTNRVRCTLTGHEMPLKIDVVQAYLKTKKFHAAIEWSKFDLKAASEYIIPHKDDDKLLWCQITDSCLNRNPAEILRHVNGRKYLRLKEQHEAASKIKKRRINKLNGDEDGSEGSALKESEDDDEEEEEVEEEEEDSDDLADLLDEDDSEDDN